MANSAILIGNSQYRNLQDLDCCRADLAAMHELLAATQKFDNITTVENVDADTLKQQLQEAVDKVASPNELFFYFSGHGYGHEGELFYCTTNFDAKQPNLTGLSTTELHAILRPANAALVVKVIDACCSGTRLIKSEESIFGVPKDGFQSIIQIASSLETQGSLTGDPLSLFTGKFRDAALRKSEGPVSFMDIINGLKDAFIDDESQTPFFVLQTTGREHFVDDARKFDSIRKTLEAARAVTLPPVAQPEAVPIVPPTLLERLQAAEAKVVTPELMRTFVGKFFDELNAKISTDEFAEFFTLDTVEHSRFAESTAEQFIIRVLTKEKRADNFVTASYERKLRKTNPLFGAAAWDILNPNSIYDEYWDLQLNCSMERAQLKITFTPKFANLQRITLVVTCAPSLDHCYIFEAATQHLLQDFGTFDRDGPEVSRRWWKCVWADGTGGIVSQISRKIAEVVREQLESAEKRLSGQKGADA
ncbi:caspase family protein [Bradyrhizobium sp. DASA03076]|uniref:caspase family protein n=1 Tax=Bradyrhizobium sp. BLXBL-03 TaxID=3395916 RepID=UPI003F7075BC